MSDGKLDDVMKVALKYIDRVDMDLILPATDWVSSGVKQGVSKVVS